ncbi:MAG: transglycosylase SLT domain-containing protein [Proteobacteria bacterium]|nr:transglycosylase SLT domain-containing protein [Pseudomonadota bacterium]
MPLRQYKSCFTSLKMFNLLKKVLSYAVFVTLIANSMLLIKPATAATLEQQRKQFLEAKKVLRAKKFKTFKKLTERLKDYPLYAYLLHDYMSPRLWQIKDKQIISFLKHYADLPIANDLRRAWLKYLAKRGRWQTYLDNYTQQADVTLQCYQLLARIKTNNSAYLLEDTRSLWLSGNSQPPQCDQAFKRLYKSELMNDQLIWQRIRLAMANSKTSLAKYLSKRLNKKDRKWVSRWIAVHHNPAKWTHKPHYKDIPVAREILIHGINRLARSNINKAISRWDKLQSVYSFIPGEIAAVDRNLAIKAAKAKHKSARQLLQQISSTHIDDEIFHWRLFTALNEYDWQGILDLTSAQPPQTHIRPRWLYWRARALQETNNINAANEIFRTIADERDYYGFLAADQLGTAYKMNHHPLPEDLDEWQSISNKPAIVRARELHHLGMVYAARREWHHAFNDMSSYQMQIAAAIAANWGWHDRTILTLGKAKAYDDLILRFPLPYEKIIRKNATKRQLDLSWVYALVRAESIFMEDARSPAGALGLMQVMPATGKETAKRLGWKKFRKNYLLQSGKNVPIGTRYLKQMYDRFNHNIILATAAYNAGPHSVNKWLPETDCMEPDIWIEKIPFDETRKYVRRILFFASIYDWRMQQQITGIQQRMAAIQPKKARLATRLNCARPIVSMQ